MKAKPTLQRLQHVSSVLRQQLFLLKGQGHRSYLLIILANIETRIYNTNYFSIILLTIAEYMLIAI